MTSSPAILAAGLVLVSTIAAAVPMAASRQAGVPSTDPIVAAPQDACPLDGFDWSEPARESLPGRLREVSGMAVLDGGRLLAHDDERGIIALLDSGDGEWLGQFALGPLLPRDDFEGIAVRGGRLYLATSTGRLYEAPIGADGQTVAFRVRDTGLGQQCELEGLAADTAAGALLLSCKNTRDRALRGQVVVYAWSLERAAIAGIRFRAPEAELAPEGDSFRPSSVEVLPGGGLLLLSGADRAIAAVTPPGTVLCSRRLHSRHRQAEGLALLADGTLVIADEGSPGRLTFYPRRAP